MRNEALSPQEQAFHEEDEALREIDPFFELAGFIEDVFSCLKSGTATPDEAHQAFRAMLEQQRKIYSLSQQQKNLGKE